MGKHGPCNHCGVTSTPLWRNGPPEKPVLCNACGSRWRTKGTLSNYTPLHSRADVADEFDDRGFSNVKTMSIKKKEAKRRLNHSENLNIGKFVIKLKHVHLPMKSQDEGDSGSAISSTDLTCPTQWETNNTTAPSRKRTCFSRPKSSSIEKLTKDLYTILNEQRQSSHLFGSLEEDLIFEKDFLPIGHGSVLIRHPSSIREEESETSSLSIENNPKKGSKEGMLTKKDVEENDRESCCFSPRMMFNSSSPEDNLLMFDSSSQFVHDQNSDYGLLLDLPSNNSFPEAELLISFSKQYSQLKWIFLSYLIRMHTSPSTRVIRLPKYKRRSVSANRHFPPGCGRIIGPSTNVVVLQETLPTEKTAENETGACAKEGKSSSKEISVNCHLENGFEAIPLAVDILDSLVENGGKPSSKKTSANCRKASDSVVKAIPLAVDILDSLVENGGKSSSKKTSANCHKASDSIVETIPRTENGPFEIDILDSLVEKVVASSGILTEVNVTPKGQSEEEIPQRNVQEIGSVVNEVVQSLDLEAYIPKIKYKRRTVSAKRTFPPFCGRNAPCPTNKDSKKAEVSNADVKETTELKVGVKRSFEELNVEVKDENAEPEDSSVKETMKSASNVSKLKTLAKKTVVQDVTTKESSVDLSKSTVPTSPAKERDSDLSKVNLGKRKSEEELPRLKLKYNIIPEKNNDQGEGVPKVGTWKGENAVSKKSKDSIRTTSIINDTTEYHNEDSDKVIVHGLMAAPKCPWMKSTLAKSIQTSHGAGSSARKSKEKKPTSEKDANQLIGELVTLNVSNQGAVSSARKSKEKKLTSEKDANQLVGELVTLNVSNQGDARIKVRETLRFFQATCRKLLQEEEAKPEKRNTKRVDLLATEIVKEKKMEANKDFHDVGSVPGVEIGDEFQYRVELALVGIHRIYQGGIEYITKGGKKIATSIVASGGYADCLDNPDVLIYSGQGGLATGKKKEHEDQKLERGNLALFNSISEKNEVRVIHGTKTLNSDSKTKLTTTYTYDGLYQVEKYWQEVGPHGKLVFKFELKRIPGQPLVAWKEVKQIKKFKVREGLLSGDISLGKEPFPICAVNTVDNENPPSFEYITEMRYPKSYNPAPQNGCNCIDGCVDSAKCSCVVKNGGEIPYNYNGAIVETKDLVYECGPSCKCPLSCPNRVSQFGLKIQLEIFKTPTRGWGVRSLSSISSGSFICQYIGELLEDKEAEKRHNDEYLFDIGHNYTYCFQMDEMDNNMKLPDVSEVKEDGGYTIDAAEFGNVGRFINHSCSPNLYAQNVLYDHEDKRMPHIMLFAAENIPPLKELTYHYNYAVDSVYDSSGNLKKKNCYCGSVECTGRMY
ncbi:uncharacterized protein LOC124941575 [Impatiens glandulifera]|uniref:uncharacterized protein LOC124941575 n=1 Tax=Impatiens glandulifera TaxID=253017 RepID=UPI001FB13B02|nr:uncharacterized protein LOC124941575 [Impatiens glandulifera]